MRDVAARLVREDHGGAAGRVPAWPRYVLDWQSPAGTRGRLAILIFHRVREAPDPLFPAAITAPVFRERMAWVRAWCNVLPLDEAVRALERGRLPARALSITFDDGFADNAEVALPILRDLGLHATFFVATGFLDGGRMWNTTVIEAVRRCAAPSLDLADLGLGDHALGPVAARRATIDALLRGLKHLPPGERTQKVAAIAARAGAPLPTDLMMSSQQVRDLAAAGMGIGAHTRSHPILGTLDEAQARDEIAGGREDLEAIVREPVRLFAYPNGRPDADYRAAHVRLVRECGFDAAVSTAVGSARTGDDAFQLPRFTPWGGGAARWTWQLVRNYRTPVRRATA